MLHKIRQRYLIEDAERVLKRAWSVRLLIAAAVLSGGEIALPIFEPLVPVRWRVAFALSVFAVIVAAFVARFVAQKKLGAR